MRFKPSVTVHWNSGRSLPPSACDGHARSSALSTCGSSRDSMMTMGTRERSSAPRSSGGTSRRLAAGGPRGIDRCGSSMGRLGTTQLPAAPILRPRFGRLAAAPRAGARLAPRRADNYHRTPRNNNAPSRELMLKILLPAAACLLMTVSVEAPAAGDTGEAAFRDLYKELVETNTTLSSGSCTLAAERMAAHLKAAGMPDSDLHPFAAPDHL